MTDTAERRETLRGLLTPRMIEAVNARLAAGNLPPAIAAELPAEIDIATGRDAAQLESLLPLPTLEAIVRLTGRPPLLVRNDKVVLEPLPDLPGADAKIIAVQKYVPSVGRVEFVNSTMRWGGTGWVIDRRATGDIIITNRHVAKLVAQRAANGSGVFLRSPGGARQGINVDFREEDGSGAGDASRTVQVVAVEYLADDLAADCALLRVATTAPVKPSPLPLADKEAAMDELVTLIGYPARDARNDADAQEKYFRELYDVKRLAPGRVTQALTGQTLLMHDCTSLGGNSGSPLISLESGKVVGLHFAGVFGQGNSAVGVETLKSLLKGNLVAVPGGGATSEATFGDGVHAADFFKGRKGFSTKFLGKGKVATPWPKLAPAAAAGLAKPSDKPKEAGELRYTHFGVKYSAADKVPLMTAVNIDGQKTVRIKRGRDQWFADLRIPAAVQLGSANYADAEIDRGHLVRREDPNWGGSAQLANDDTFHYVNAAPQHSQLNQGKLLWQGLENYILDNARTGGFLASVFTGPIIGPDDPVIDGARVPLEYWKLVATLDETGTKLRATAYLLSQGQLIRDLLERRSRTEAMEGIVLGEYRTFQIAVADLADATGHDFSAYVAADPLFRPQEGAEPAAPRFIPLDSLEAMQL
ncbi:DNA/RNA non-specific endonuclease [Sandarakinorhabdus sp. DWP1-3-1]|uniref:DNA/RNA non-specific endonuclease n=1 Tax=Sandarakinorhabdus sp. DWP1-3-1 TaxID=2804627 RepID=UPI003CF1450F